MNFIVSYFIYSVVSAILCLVLIGFVFLLLIVLGWLIFPFFGAAAANKGQTYRYPLTIKFF